LRKYLFIPVFCTPETVFDLNIDFIKFYKTDLSLMFRCQAGFAGNGIDCEKEPEIGCNLVNNCAKFAACLFDPAKRAFRYLLSYCIILSSFYFLYGPKSIQ
jgi:hypothetical protein